jgi:hypothetical protein
MIDEYVDRWFEDDDFPALSISIRFRAVERFLDRLVEFVPHIQDQTLIRFKAQMEREASTLSREDIEIELEHMKSEIENSIPSSFYGSFVLVLYADLESAISDVADYVRKRESSRLSIQDLREPNSLKRLSLYLEALMKESLRAPAEVITFLQQLQLVRNVFAHANGSLKDQREERRAALQRFANENSGLLIQDNSLIPTTRFLKASVSAVAAFVNAILAQIAAKYPAIPRGGR